MPDNIHIAVGDARNMTVSWRRWLASMRRAGGRLDDAGVVGRGDRLSVGWARGGRGRNPDQLIRFRQYPDRGGYGSGVHRDVAHRSLDRRQGTEEYCATAGVGP